MRSTFHSSRRRLIAAALVVLVCAAAGVAAMAQSASATVTTLATFTTPGPYVWTVPTGVTAVTFDVYGARGGGVVSVNHGIVSVVSQGGAGGEAKGRFAVVAGEKFEIVVGGQGGLATEGVSTGSGGSNGGGWGALLDYDGGGGGASDVRIGGRGNACASSKSCGYGDRIVVGGGGGGGADTAGLNGYAGGGLTGGGTTCQTSGVSATQECGGPGAYCGEPGSTRAGGFGPGGGNCDTTYSGGGGGWYGGGAAAPGGGGSGFISRLALGGSFPGGTNQGDGKVIITTS